MAGERRPRRRPPAARISTFASRGSRERRARTPRRRRRGTGRRAKARGVARRAEVGVASAGLDEGAAVRVVLAAWRSRAVHNRRRDVRLADVRPDGAERLGEAKGLAGANDARGEGGVPGGRGPARASGRDLTPARISDATIPAACRLRICRRARGSRDFSRIRVFSRELTRRTSRQSLARVDQTPPRRMTRLTRSPRSRSSRCAPRARRRARAAFLPAGSPAASRSRRSVFQTISFRARTEYSPPRASLPSPSSPHLPPLLPRRRPRPRRARRATPSSRASRRPRRPSCADAGAESHRGCEDPLDDGHPFDLWELARSWTPGFCASGGARTCAKEECAVSTMVPALTLHGLWPSFAEPVERATCFWPQDCSRPPWLPASAAWTYDASLLPSDPTSRTLAPAWYADGLGAHEWPKHGTCAAWSADAGRFGLDAGRTTPRCSPSPPKAPRTRSSPRRAATRRRCVFRTSSAGRSASAGMHALVRTLQVVTCYDRGGEAAGRAPRQCPCVGVPTATTMRCARAHACAAVKVLSPEETGCDGEGTRRDPRAERRASGRACCPG